MEFPDINQVKKEGEVKQETKRGTGKGGQSKSRTELREREKKKGGEVEDKSPEMNFVHKNATELR